jgi:hypothetical protein
MVVGGRGGGRDPFNRKSIWSKVLDFDNYVAIWLKRLKSLDQQF